MERTVIFVCEHGAAKSIVAAAYFNKLAGERHLGIQAMARGTDPDNELAEAAVKGLAGDGLRAGEHKPVLLSEWDAANAMALISFCELPKVYDGLTPVEQWLDVPPVSVDYEKSRDVMLERLKRYLDELEQER